nr:hypothetical protein [Tanacetum cinerariifolium]
MGFRLVDGNSFDCPPDSYHPPHPTYETYSEKKIAVEQVAKAQTWKLPVCYDDDDDEESSNSLEDNIISELPSYSAVTPAEPIDSLSMGDEHHDTIPKTESDEFIKSCVETLVPNPSESKGENECDVPAGFTTFSNVLFDADYDFDSSDDLSLSDKDRLLYDNSSPRPPEEIIFDNSHADIESFSPSPIPNKDSDSNMEEIDLPFNPDDLMPPGIEDDNYDSRRDILILEKVLDNYSLSLPANESYHFDIPSPYRPPAKPPDGLSTFLPKLSKIYLEKLNFLPEDKHMTTDAIEDLTSFHDVLLALIHYSMQLHIQPQWMKWPQLFASCIAKRSICIKGIDILQL